MIDQELHSFTVLFWVQCSPDVIYVDRPAKQDPHLEHCSEQQPSEGSFTSWLVIDTTISHHETWTAVVKSLRGWWSLDIRSQDLQWLLEPH